MKKTLFIVLAFLLASCSSPAPHFFQTTSVSQVDKSYDQVRTIILLNQVLLPASVSRPQISTLGKHNYEMKIDEFNRWGASPERMIQQVLNNDLSLYLPNATIENQTPLKKNYHYAVAVEVLEFNGRLDDFATLKASYFIKNKMGRMVKSGKFDKTQQIDGKYGEYVLAQSNLLAELAQKIAEDVSLLK